MAIINLFFIPVIALCIFAKLKGISLKPDLHTAAHYMITCALVAVATKIIIFAARFIFSLEPIPEDSAYHSVIALAVSVILPFIADKIKFEIKKD